MKKILAFAFILGIGCASFKHKLTEVCVDNLVDDIILGQWSKDGTTAQDYYADNWACQRQTSFFDQTDGTVFDLKAYAACMNKRGWKLTPANPFKKEK